MNAERVDDRTHGSPGGRLVAVYAAAAVWLYTAWLAFAFLSIVSSESQAGAIWPLPGAALSATVLAAAIGGFALARMAMGRRKANGTILWLTGGTLVGLGILTGFSVGGEILPLGVALLLAAAFATVRQPRRLFVGATAAAAVGTLAFVGTPMLEGLAWIGAPVLPIDRVVPQPGAVDVPLTTHISVTTKSLPANDGTTESLRVQYTDRGFAWLRPAVPGAEGGRSSMSANGDVGPSTFTFVPRTAFETCRAVGVRVVARGYRPYRFAFRTACSTP